MKEVEKVRIYCIQNTVSPAISE